MNKQILIAWEELKTTPFPDPPASGPLSEIRAELANISTFGSGCFHSCLHKGQLATAHYAVLLNCLNALQRVEGKLAIACATNGDCAPDELEGLQAYKEALERFLEAILISCNGKRRGNGSCPSEP